MSKLYLMILGIFLFLNWCAEDFGYDHEIFVLENRSGESIWARADWWMVDISEDSMILTPYDVFNKLDPKGLKKIEDGANFEDWTPPKEELVEGFNFQVLIFKESTRNRYTDEELVENDIYDYRYILSLEDLKACNFTVTYTGQSVADTNQ